jgi:WhiB family transcriptional regulator, redox-sensing transcriptional regulator
MPIIAQLAPLVSRPGHWRDLALCAQVDPELFFPEKGESSRPAKRVCVACVVRAECLQEALDRGERFGVWGGLSERERRDLAARLAGQPRQVRRCPAHGEELSGGPVLYHCPAGQRGHGVTPSDFAQDCGSAA